MSERDGRRWMMEAQQFLDETQDHPELILRWLDERYTNVTYLRKLITELYSMAAGERSECNCCDDNRCHRGEQ